MPYAAKQHGATLKARKPKKIRPPKISDPFYSCKRWRKVRKIALLRDNYTCTQCNTTPMKSQSLHVDHIKARQDEPSMEYQVDNLQTLCISCHNRKTHGKGHAPVRESAVRPISGRGGDREDVQNKAAHMTLMDA